MKLSKHARFRKEEDYILLCRVDTLQYFHIENKWFNVLLCLKDSLTLDNATQEKDLHIFLKDLEIMGVLENE